MSHPQQLGFGFEEMLREQETAHLPSTIAEAIPYYRKLIERHHEAMMAGDKDLTMKIREEAFELATKLNGGRMGICAPDGAGSILERATAAPEGTVPEWGQMGDHIIDVDKMRVRIKQSGIFGIGSHAMHWLGFGAHAVDYDKPFLSETGYRSFIGLYSEPLPGLNPADFAREVIHAYIVRECKGKPRKIEQGYVEREMQRRAKKSEQEHAQ